ncbi:transcriptional regulator SinR [Neobacillus bataviensis LMG 21833]|uniref:Transcriptional regulator SinR n=1 Tax=Neobacillus bataviensis LMG 21833 TaxID=1117379 RepID=K6DLQ5_9BACI|nr:helix-turn-helix transcriptional regulator [Neobacillus bataviensis]EKN69249.1 transcriptional regulator SinR [Neobacillus bataviensis LMG 21833]
MLGTQIQNLRRGKRLTLTQLAEKTGISKSYLSHIERDIQKNPSIDILMKLSLALDVNIQTLIKSNNSSINLEESSDIKGWCQLIENALESGIVDDTFWLQILQAIRNSKTVK